MKPLLNAFIGLLLLVGCKSTQTQVQVQSTWFMDSPLTKGYGLLMLQVVNNTDRLNDRHQKWDEIIVTRVDNIPALMQSALEKARAQGQSNATLDTVKWSPDIYVLNSHVPDNAETQTYVAELPQGQYRVTSLFTSTVDQYHSSWKKMPVQKFGGYFDVKEGRLTDLGTLVYQPLNSTIKLTYSGRESKGQSFVARFPEHQAMHQQVLSHYPRLKKSLDLQQILSWTPDNMDDFRQSLSSSVLLHAYHEGDRLLAHSGSGAILSRLGQIKFQNTEGQWQIAQLPTRTQPFSILEEKQGVLVGGEHGLLFTAPSLYSEKWSKHQAVNSSEVIIWMGKTAKGYYALTRAKRTFIVYQFETPTSTWKNLKRFDKPHGLITDKSIFAFITQAGSLRVHYQQKMHEFSSETKTWHEEDTKSMANLTNMGNGVLIGLSTDIWTGVQQIISFNDGQNWTMLKHKHKTSGPARYRLPLPMKDNQVASLGLIKQGQEFILKVVTANPTKFSKESFYWKSHGNARTDCTQALPTLTRGNTLFFKCDDSRVISTSNFGETWEVELTNGRQQLFDKYEGVLKTLNQTSDTSRLINR